MESEEDLIENLFIGFTAIKSIVFDLETLRRNIPDDEFIDSQLFAISTLVKSRMARFEDDLISFVEMNEKQSDDVSANRYKQERYEFVDEECADDEEYNTDYMKEGL